MWNPLENTDEENSRWIHLRAVEWAQWPVFVMQPVAPLLMTAFPVWEVAVTIALANVLWAFRVRQQFVSAWLSSKGLWIAKLKWITIPFATWMLVEQHRYWTAVLALLWPIVDFPLMITGAYPQARIGDIEISLAQDLIRITSTKAS